MNRHFEFVKAQIQCKESIFNILEKAKKFQKQNDINQWNDEYPTIDHVTDDISNGRSYVMKLSGMVAATVSLSFVNINTLKNQNDNNCVMINRLAVDVDLNIRGLGSKIMTFIEEYAIEKGAEFLIASTHKTNHIMQKLFAKCDFYFCQEHTDKFSTGEYLYFVKKCSCNLKKNTKANIF